METQTERIQHYLKQFSAHARQTGKASNPLGPIIFIELEALSKRIDAIENKNMEESKHGN